VLTVSRFHHVTDDGGTSSTIAVAACMFAGDAGDIQRLAALLRLPQVIISGAA